jgi:hypothetical protein
MINEVMLYLFIGAIITLILDIASVLYQTENKLENVDRIKLIILWPLYVLMFIIILIFEE